MLESVVISKCPQINYPKCPCILANRAFPRACYIGDKANP